MAASSATYVHENRNTYHHGDLRQQLLKRGTILLNQRGVRGLSMRVLADELGVSRAAAYHHFKNKQELFCGIAERGFIRINILNRRLTKRMSTPFTENDLELWLRGNINFFVRNSEMYNLMFSRELWHDADVTDSLYDASRKTFRFLAKWFEEQQQAGYLPKEFEATRMAQVLWSTVHGVGQLFNEGVYAERATMYAVIKTTAAVIMLMVKNDGAQPIDN